MTSTLSSRARLAASLGAGALLLLPLTACSGDSLGANGAPDTGAAASSAADVAASASSAASSAAGAATSAASAADDRVNVDCNLASCSVTLKGTNARAEVLNTSVALESVSGGQATVSVGDQRVSCSEGQSVGAGSLRLQCTNVGDDSVTLTASVG